MLAVMAQEVTLCTTTELARVLHVNGSTVRRWVARGTITPSLTTPGGHHRFDLDQVREQLQKAGAAA